MGRCNNRRTQQAAQALRNTPSRARFSRPPPSRKSNSKTNKNGGRGGGSSGRGTNSTHHDARHKTAVIDKLTKRVQDKSRTATNSSVTARPNPQHHQRRRRVHALDGVDIAKLDQVTLSEESIQLVTRLLQDLNVMESSTRESQNSEEDEQFADAEYNDETETHEDEAFSDEDRQKLGPTRGGGYSEYDEDVDEGYMDTVGIGDSTQALEEDGVLPEESSSPDDNNDDSSVRKTPVFLHLTKKLSFSEEHALRSCIAIQSWEIPDKKGEQAATRNERGDVVLDGDELGLAMDWLCLHLTDSELKAGFQPNPQAFKRNNASSDRSASGLILAGTGRTRPIPHSSISVAKPITSDQEWRDTLRRESRKVGFLRLGFHHLEAEKACDATMHVNEKLSSEQDEDGLRVLLSRLEKEVLGDHFSAADPKNSADLEFCKTEREQEMQALEAIYDEHIKVVGDVENGKSRYIVEISPVEELQEPARSEECKLHVFLRPGYPVLASPLCLFSNPSLPPSLLRRVNEELIRQSNQNVGEASVFKLVDFLCNSISGLQKDFAREQRSKEFEMEQLRLRKEAGHSVEAVIEAQYENDGKLGRRQRAKLKAAEKSFDRADQLNLADKERKQRQNEHVERIKDQDQSIRQMYADRAVEEHTRQRIEEEAEKAARSAMNDAFIRGEDVDGARAAALRARKQCLRSHGEEVSFNDDEDDDEISASASVASHEPSLQEDHESASPIQMADLTKRGNATPTTIAFMERLRQYYNDAAHAKSKSEAAEELVSSRNKQSKLEDTIHYRISEPRQRIPEVEVNEKESASKHIPTPVPVPTGDLADVMSDVIKCQLEQPWLVAPEARIPVTSSDEKVLPPEELQRRDKISRDLKEQLEKKLKAAEEWEKRNPDKARMKTKTGPMAQQYSFMLQQRCRLPAFEMKKDIVETIATNQITVISGDTGCGKTTQVPQLVLDSMILSGQGAEANMIVTQPRRISAIGVSERIAAERIERVGETAGYSIRLENKRSSFTRILLCTTGILLRRLQCDPDLASVSHVFVDEVHERDLNTDFLLIVLKDLLARRSSLKLVLMSATLNADAFSAYFGGAPVVSIPGRAYPVAEKRLEDILQLTGYEVQEDSDYAVKNTKSRPMRFSKSALRKMYFPKYKSSVINSLAIVDETIINYELLADLLESITLNNDEGAILVFMPGMMEITKAIEELYKKEFFQSSKVLIYPLHSSISTAEQTAVFDVPPEGVRKIVVATNIAETSITIEDVVFVVDTGRVKENRKDEVNEMPTLVETWVSRASAKQRRGRAGRVRPGVSYHMYSSHTYEQDLEDYQLPEMLRVGLEDLVLQILLLDLGEPTSFLANAVNPPSALAMKNSLKLLEGLGAVEVEWAGNDSGCNGVVLSNAADKKVGQEKLSCQELSADSNLTALGFHLATLPVDPRVGKMMIYGALFQCIDPALTIAASMSARSPFVSPFDKREAADEARKQFATDGSDHLTTLRAFNEWKKMRRTRGDKAAQAFLKENFLSRLTLFQMEDLRRQFAGLLVDIGFLPRKFRLKADRAKSTPLNGDSVSANVNSGNVALVKAVLCAGLYPNVIVAPRSLAKKDGGLSDKEAGECAFQSLKGDVFLHPCTISFHEKRLESRYCCYHEIVKTSKTYVRDCTTVNEYALLLFGGSLKVYHSHGVVTVDDWLKFRIDAKPATLVKHLRAQMENVLLKKIVSPEEDVTGSPEGKALIEAVCAVLAREVHTHRLDGAEIVKPWTRETDNSTSNGLQGGRQRRGRHGGGHSGRGRGERGR